MSPDTKKYISENKSILFLFLLWMFRLLFLQQGNEGGVVINKFVVVQLFAELGIFFALLARRFNFCLILGTAPIGWFTILYLLGMASIAWGILPLMSCYFAFQNIIMLAALFYLASRTKDFFQLERFYVFANLFVLLVFLLRCVFFGGFNFHSVAYSTVAGFLLVYCVAEYDKSTRPPENVRMLGRGIFWGILGLILTTSSGAMVSVAVAFLVLAMFAKHPGLKALAFLCICAVLIGYFSGASDWVFQVLFPGKSMWSIQTAHGRTVLWSMILERAAERPWLGWGFASVERTLPLYTINAHNAVIGTLGSQGYVGCGILILAMLTMFFFIWGKVGGLGFRGLFAACVCGFVNSNTSNFIATKAGLQSLAFQMIIILASVYYLKSKEKPSSMANVAGQLPQRENRPSK